MNVSEDEMPTSSRERFLLWCDDKKLYDVIQRVAALPDSYVEKLAQLIPENIRKKLDQDGY